MKLNEKIDTWISSHSIEEKVAQVFMVTPDQFLQEAPVTVAHEATQQAILSCPVGVIYFSDNLLYWEQTRDML